MIEIKGKYGTALLMTDSPEEQALKQVYEVLNMPYSKNILIRYMADMHAGKGCTVGYTQTLGNYVVPNFVGVDIGCGVYAYQLPEQVKSIDFKELDDFIKQNIPHGESVNKGEYTFEDTEYARKLALLAIKIGADVSRIWKSVGSLGGGNHFIEIGQAPDNRFWLTIHSGSRNFGLKVAEYHQNRAVEFVKYALVDGIQRGMEYLPLAFGGDEYLDDMEIAQKFAHMNRQEMAKRILGFFGVKADETIFSVHNYIDMEDKVLRKGAIRADAGMRCVIPFNMRDGIAVCMGKGSRKWNNSAPHGAGRIMSRSKAKESIRMEDYEKTMANVWSSCITKSTIDESPFAYKNYEQVINEMNETVSVLYLIKPIYNFKAS